MAFNPVDILNGNLFAGGANSKAQDYLGNETGAYNDIQIPQLQQLAGVTVNPGADVQYSPVEAAQMSATQAGPSAMAGISTDPRLAQDQAASLGALRDLAARGGMNDQDRANLNAIQDQTAQADQGRRDAILQNAAARGMSSSGNSLLAQLSSSQAATQQANQQGLNVAGQAQARALNAMLQGGQMAQSQQAQQFNQQAQKAQAQDAVSRFNASQSQAANQYNTGAANQMGQFNANNALNAGMANRQTDLSGQEYNANVTNNVNRYNAGIPQTQFQDQMGKASGIAGANQAGVNYWGKQAANNQGAFGNMMGGATSILASGLGKGGFLNNGSGSSGGTADAGTGDTSGGFGGSTPTSDFGGGAGYTGGGDASGMDFSGLGGNWRGGIVPGHAAVHGNSPVNDTKIAKVAPGEVILPRSVVQAPHPMQAVKGFLGHLQPAAAADASSGVNPEQLGAFLQSLNPRKLAMHETPFSEGSDNDQNTGDFGAKMAALNAMIKQK